MMLKNEHLKRPKNRGLLGGSSSPLGGGISIRSIEFKEFSISFRENI